MNQLQITGILGKDAILQHYSGTDLVQFSVAVNDDFKDTAGNWQKRTAWYDCTIWNTNKTDRLLKGTLVFVQGVPRLNTYQKQDGSFGASVRVSVSKFEVLRKSETASQVQPANTNYTPPAAYAPPAEEIADDLPF